MGYTEAQKRASKKWVEKNKERVREYQRVYFSCLDENYSKIYYQNNREVKKKRVLDRYYFNKECERLRQIDFS